MTAIVAILGKYPIVAAIPLSRLTWSWRMAHWVGRWGREEDPLAV